MFCKCGHKQRGIQVKSLPLPSQIFKIMCTIGPELYRSTPQTQLYLLQSDPKDHSLTKINNQPEYHKPENQQNGSKHKRSQDGVLLSQHKQGTGHCQNSHHKNEESACNHTRHQESDRRHIICMTGRPQQRQEEGKHEAKGHTHSNSVLRPVSVSFQPVPLNRPSVLGLAAKMLSKTISQSLNCHQFQFISPCYLHNTEAMQPGLFLSVGENLARSALHDLTQDLNRSKPAKLFYRGQRANISCFVCYTLFRKWASCDPNTMLFTKP